MFPIMLSTVECIGAVLLFVGLGVAFVAALLGSACVFSFRAMIPIFAVGAALMLSPSIASVAATTSSLGELVMVDRDRSVEVVLKATELGLSDFSCLQDCGKMTYSCMADIESAMAAAKDRMQSQEIKSLAGIPQ